MKSYRFLLVMALSVVTGLAVSSATFGDKAKGRARVKDFNFEFEPSNTPAPGLKPLKVCILPLINSNDLSRHTRNVEKAFRNLDPEEYPRVIGVRYNQYGKPLNRFLTGEPFEDIVGKALQAEFEALGMEIVAAPATPPADLRTRTLLASAPDAQAADILIAGDIEDFYFNTKVGYIKLKMETFFILDLRVVDVSAGELLWEGSIEAGEFETKAMVMGRDAVENRLDGALRDLIEGVLRNNQELQARLAELDG